MADQSDIENALVTQIAAVLLPGIVYKPGAFVESVPFGFSAKIIRGWPIEESLNASLRAGMVQITVYPEPGMTRLTTRYTPEWFVPIAPVETLGVGAPALYPGYALTAENGTALLSEAGLPLLSDTPRQAITFTIAQNAPGLPLETEGGIPLETESGATLLVDSGVISPNQIVGVALGPGMAQIGYACRVGQGDTPTTVAAALAALIPGAATAGATLIVPSLYPIWAAVLADAAALMEVRRQTQGFRVSCWCFSPGDRDAVATAVDQALGAMFVNGSPTEFITLPNGEAARVTYRARYRVDKTQKAGLWREDLCFMVEYATTIAQTQPRQLFGALGLTTGFGGLVTTGNATANSQPPG